MLLPMETKGTILKDVFPTDTGDGETEMDSLLRSKIDIKHKLMDGEDVEKAGCLESSDE